MWKHTVVFTVLFAYVLAAETKDDEEEQSYLADFIGGLLANAVAHIVFWLTAALLASSSIVLQFVGVVIVLLVGVCIVVGALAGMAEYGVSSPRTRRRMERHSAATTAGAVVGEILWG